MPGFQYRRSATYCTDNFNVLHNFISKSGLIRLSGTLSETTLRSSNYW